MAEHTSTIRPTFVYALPQEFATQILSVVITNTPPPTLSAHRISVPILREEEHSTAHFH
ncbi:MAG: hypothetical protein H0V70_09615 [Ktedonobacteraceae bacterium]|nr:hypothetical protein [Ktedonobacteraceae bacterium]